MIKISPGFNPFRCWRVSSPILPAPMTSTVLSAKESKTSLARSTATLATDSFPGPCQSVHGPVCRLGVRSETQCGRLGRLCPLNSGAICLANLAEDLSLSQDQTFETGRHSEQMVDDSFVVVADQVFGENSDLMP